MTPSTYFGLLAEFGTAHVPIVELGKKYFNLSEEMAKRDAAANKYPFPVFKVGTNKSVWMADIADVAKYIDEVKEKAKKEYRSAK